MEKSIEWMMKQADRATIRMRAQLEDMTMLELEDADAVLKVEQRRKEKRFEVYAHYFDNDYKTKRL